MCELGLSSLFEVEKGQQTDERLIEQRYCGSIGLTETNVELGSVTFGAKESVRKKRGDLRALDRTDGAAMSRLLEKCVAQESDSTHHSASPKHLLWREDQGAAAHYRIICSPHERNLVD